MASVVNNVSRHGLTIDVCDRNQHNKSKIAFYKPLLHLKSYLKWLLRSNKTGHFSYKGGCGVHGLTHIEMFKRRAGLGYR